MSLLLLLLPPQCALLALADYQRRFPGRSRQELARTKDQLQVGLMLCCC